MRIDVVDRSDSGEAVPIGMVVGGWLSYSETFIYDQLRHQRRFKALVLAYERLPTAERFPYEPVVTLDLPERARYWALGQSPTFLARLREHRPQLIHAHYGTNGVKAVPLARALGCPLVVTFHGHDVGGLLPPNRRTLRYGKYQRLAPRMFRQADLLICASQELADTLVGRVGAPAHKILVHRLGVDLGQFQPVERPAGPVRVLLIGRFVEKKGFEYALRALAQVHGEFPDLTARLVGDGPLAAELRSLVSALALDQAVTFCGVLDQAGVRREMAAADLLMAPSVVARNGDRESGVIVIKEAAATGLPTLGTYHGGIPEIIEDGHTGFLVPERQVRPLAERLRELVANRELRLSLGRAARRKIEDEYDTVKQNAALEDIFASLLRAPTTRSRSVATTRREATDMTVDPKPGKRSGELPAHPTRRHAEEAPRAQYDPSYFLRHSRRNRKRLEAIIGHLPAGQRVLDIGCNRGYFSQAVLDHDLATAVDGVEPSREQVDPDLLRDERFTLYEGDIAEFDFPKTYSAIIYCAVHHHVFGHRGYLEAFRLWQRILDACERYVFFETGQVLEGSRWYWQRALRRYFPSDEEHIGALLQAAGPRLEKVNVIARYSIHKTRRWLLRIDLHPPAPEGKVVEPHSDKPELSYERLNSYRRTVGSRNQQLVRWSSADGAGPGEPLPDDVQVHEGTAFSLCRRADNGELVWCKKSLADPFKDEREQRLGEQIEGDLFVRPITVHPELGLIFPYVEGLKLSGVDLRRAANKSELIDKMLDIFEQAAEARVLTGELDIDPRQRGSTRRLIELVDLHPSNILVQQEGDALRLRAVIDFEYYGNHNRARNARHLAKLIRRSRVLSPRTLKFLGRTLYWNLKHQASWALTTVEDRLYEGQTTRLRRWILKARELLDRLLRPWPGHWQ